MKKTVISAVYISVAVLFVPVFSNAAEVKKAEPKPGVIEARFDRIDKNKDKKISIEEFKADMKGERTFKRFDYDEDGFISFEEYQDDGKNPPAKIEEDNPRKKTFRVN